MSRSHTASKFQAALTRHMMTWRVEEANGKRSPMWNDWLDGMHSSVRDCAREVVERSGLKLHEYARALPSSQAFAFNLFLPFMDGPARDRLSNVISKVVGSEFTIDRIDIEWVPPGALLGEIKGDKPSRGEPATGVDAVLWGRSAGHSAAVLVEVKLSESGFTNCGGAVSRANERVDICGSARAFLENPRACYLQRPRRASRDRRYWEIFEQAHGSVRAAFPGALAEGRCPFEGEAQQPMRNLAIAEGLVQAGNVRRAWFMLAHHDANPDVPAHWESWARLLPARTTAPVLHASAVLAAGVDSGLTDWAVWMAKRYHLPLPQLRYARAPSPEFLRDLAPDGELSFLLQPREVAGLPLDVHFREMNHLRMYCGLTHVLDVAYRGGGVTLSAHETYRAQAPGLFRNWPRTEYPQLRDQLNSYLACVQVGSRHTSKEGAVQATWAQVGVGPWVAVDREAVIGYSSAALQGEFRRFEAVRRARSELEGEGFALPAITGPAAELDQLAVDHDGALVLIELKHSSAAADKLAGAPLQLLQYVWEWYAALPSLRGELQKLQEARRAVGLPASEVPLSGLLRAVIGLDHDRPSEEVRRRMDLALAIANKHLPYGVPPIEVRYVSC